MAITENTLFDNSLDSDCTESFRDDIDIVIERRMNYIMQKVKLNIKNKKLQQKINSLEIKLKTQLKKEEQNKIIENINCIADTYWNLIYQYMEDAYKQGFKDSIQLMFITNN